MGKAHPGIDLLSAFADGEIDRARTAEIQAHLDVCAPCRAKIRAFSGLDRALAAAPALSCAASTELRSALLDGQLTAAEAAVALGHVAGCASCSADQAAWLAADAAIRQLPHAVPSAAADAAIRLVAEEHSRLGAGRRPLGGFVPGAGFRIGVAAAVVMAIVIGLLPASPQAPDPAQQAPAQEQALVASVQQVVLYQKTNTFYVLQTADAAVDALDASSYALRARIAVGGRPTALALDEAQSVVVVLDAAAKSITQIDAEKNTVVATMSVPVSGTPTSLQVDPSSGKVVVAASAIVDTGGGGSPSPSPSRPGQVALLDLGTKQLEVVRNVAVAPKLVVSDPAGKGTLLVSSSGTTFVDKTYQPLRTLPGGVGAAFGAQGKIAVLAASGGDAILSLITGDGAPVPLRLAGTPQAITPMPGGGFAVLLGSGSGNGRIVVVDESGRSVASTDIGLVARDFAYDDLSGRFTLVRDGQVASVDAPAGIVARSSDRPSPSSLVTVPPTSSPAPGPAATSPASSASPAGSPSPVPDGSRAPASSPIASAPLASSEPLPAGIPRDAVALKPDLYHASLPGGRVPVMWSATPVSMWMLDDRNLLSQYDTSSGERMRSVELPKGAHISTLVAGRTHIYALDPSAGRLYTLRLGDDRLVSQATPLFQLGVAMVSGRNDALWMYMSGSRQLVSVDAVSGRIEVVDIGMFGITQLAVDGAGALWAADAEKGLGRYDPTTGAFTQLAVPGAGRNGALLADPLGSLWVGTTTGDVFQFDPHGSRLVRNVQRPIASLAIDPTGRPWYLAPATSGAGYAFAPVDGSSEARIVLGPALGATFSPAWRAWLPDASGGFWVSLEQPR